MKPFTNSTPALLCLAFFLLSCTGNETTEVNLDLPELELRNVMQVSESDDFLLGSITNVMVDSDGEMILVDYQQRSVHAVDQEGNYLQQIGANGAGPGEYELPGVISLGKDNSIHVLDWSTRGLITFAKENTGWEFDTDFIADNTKTGFFSQFYPAGNREFVVVSSPPGINSEDGSMVVRKINTANEILRDSILVYPLNENFLIENNGMPVISFTIPEVHRQGRFFRDYNGNDYYGWTDSLDIRRRTPDSDSFEKFIELELNNKPLTNQMGDSVLNRYNHILDDFDQARGDLRSSFPDTMPLFQNFLADDKGYVWVQIFTEDDEPNWLIFDDEGTPVYRTSLPVENRLAALRHNKAYTISKTEDDLPAINIFEYEY